MIEKELGKLRYAEDEDLEEIADLIELMAEQDYYEDRYETAGVLAYKIRTYGTGADKAEELSEAHEGKIAALAQMKDLAMELEKCYNSANE